MDYKKFQAYQNRALATVYEEGEDSFHNNIIVALAEKYLAQLHIPTTAAILDIGCGAGAFIETAQNLGYKNVTGVTLSEQDAETCRSKGFVSVTADMSDLPFDDALVDFVWCRHALEHSPYPLFTLYEFYRVMKPNALIYIDVPAPDNERIMLGEYNANHYSILGENMWLALFMKAGFEIVATEGYGLDVDQLGKIWKERCYVFVVRKPA